MQPLECKHHLKSEEFCKYREGVTLKRPVKKNCGSWVDIGLNKVNINYKIPGNFSNLVGLG